MPTARHQLTEPPPEPEWLSIAADRHVRAGLRYGLARSRFAVPLPVGGAMQHRRLNITL